MSVSFSVSRVLVLCYLNCKCPLALHSQALPLGVADQGSASKDGLLFPCGSSECSMSSAQNDCPGMDLGQRPGWRD